MEIYRGIVAWYDETNHKADVMLLGSMSGVVLGVPVSYQVAPEEMAADTPCGVMFFGEGDAGVVVCTFDGVAGPLLRRGWEDDFLGGSLAPEYAFATSGASTAVLQAAHGGVVRLTTGAAAWNYVFVALGSFAHTEASLDADEGWVQHARMRLQANPNNNRTFMGGTNAANDTLYVGSETDEANWVIIAGLGGWNVHASAEPIDMQWHWHRLRVRPTDGGHEIKHYLDGVDINTVTADIPTNLLTPLFFTQTAAAVGKVSDWDYWRVVPGSVATP